MRDAKSKLYALLELDSSRDSYAFVYQKYEDSVQRMLKVMGFDVLDVESLDVVLHRTDNTPFRLEA